MLMAGNIHTEGPATRGIYLLRDFCNVLARFCAVLKRYSVPAAKKVQTDVHGGTTSTLRRRLPCINWIWLVYWAALCAFANCATFDMRDRGAATNATHRGFRSENEVLHGSLQQIHIIDRAAPFHPSDVFNLPDYEIQALLDLYVATNGTRWQWRIFVLFGPEWDFTGNPEPCAAPWQGITCTDLPRSDGYLHITGLDLDNRGLAGTLPASLFNLTHLDGLMLGNNDIHGSIPSGIGRLAELVHIDLSVNHLTGELPEGVANCSKLYNLFLSSNNISGTLPEGLGNITSLTGLELTDNLFEGPLPLWIAHLPYISVAKLSGNLFSGSIPDTYGTLVNCTFLSLGYNGLTGTLPASFAGLRSILQLELSLNSLHGGIPDWIGQLSTLVRLFLDDNYFTGPIPAALGQLPQLTIINLCYNALTGSLPSAVSDLASLKTLKINRNLLHGSLPAALTSLVGLDTMDVSGNLLSGSLPPALGSMVDLYFASLDDNHFSGTIPASLGNLSKVTVLNLADNHLRGPVPPELGKLKSLADLYLNDNFLTGTLPPELSSLEGIVTLFAQNNSLRGTLDGVFSATKQRKLTLIELGSNELTGTVPDEIFSLSSLFTIVLVENCFTGVHLESICNCKNLSTVILDGLRSAEKCRGKVLPGISNAYVLTSQALGTVPPCLFSMQYLYTLHLSSNRLTGSLPGNISITSPLFDLSLSHNKLTGDIPQAIQEKFWFNLDLSYNKFGGEMNARLGYGFNSSTSSAIAQLRGRVNLSGLPATLPPSALTLRNNRLSDRVPASVKSMLNISVLSGNLLTCNLDDSDLPKHDNGKASYHCGSESFDRTYYLWMALVAALGASLLLFGWWLHTVPTTARGAYYASLLCRVQSWYAFTSWYAPTDPSLRLSNFKFVLNAFDAICRAACWITLAVMVVMLPAYTAARINYGTHSHEYAWSVSAAFLSGYAALGLLLAAFVIFLVLAAVVYKRQVRLAGQGVALHSTKAVTPAFDKVHLFSTPSSQEMGLYVLYFVINFAVSFGANAAYITVVLHENSRYFVPAQIGLSVFKVCWNSIGAVRLARWTWQQVVAIRGAYARQDSSFFALQLFVGMFNYIAIPCLVVGVISPDCFNTLFVGESHVSSTYFYESCAVFGRTSCLSLHFYTSRTSFVPPFTYSYQCSSSLITYYAASFVYMALIVTFVNPAVNLFLRWLYVHRQSFPRLAKRIERLCPTVLRDLSQDIVVYNAYSPYFDARQRIVEVMTYFGVLLTFGLVFPPLAAAMLVAIVTTVAAMKVKIGHFLTAAVDAGQPYYLQVVDSECKGVASPRMLRICAMQLLCFTCFFYAPFLFDTLSDTVGTTEALWVVVIVPLFPALIFAGNWLAEKWGGGQGGVPGGGSAATEDLSSAEQRDTEVEMSKVELGAGGANREPRSADEQEGVATLSALHTPTAGGESL